jgi:serine/threonine protein kinase
MSTYKTIANINESHKVYLVQDEETGKIYVRKVLDIYNYNVYYQLYQNPVAGIPRIFDITQAGNQLIIIEEYITGSSLQELLDISTLKSEYAYSYILSLCDIVQKLHSQNPPIIHRDIKPSNIIITPDDHVVLIDFNAAKYYSEADKIDTVLLGTKGYAAPEQYGFGASSPETDIYAIGILINEILGHAPTIANANVINAITKKCTELNPHDRYSNIEDLKRALTTARSVKNTSSIPRNPSFDMLSGKMSGCFSYFPPGFRTGKLWHMMLASISYIFIFWLCLTLEVKDVTVPVLWLERCFCLIIMLSVIFFTFNYMDIQQNFPLCSSDKRVKKIFGVILWDVIIMFGLFVIMLIIEQTIFKV